MPKVRFLHTRTVKDGTGTTYEEGVVYDLPQASAERWIRRGAAVAVSNRAHAHEAKRVSEHGDVLGVSAEEAEAAARQAEAEAAAKAAAEEAARAAAEQAERDREEAEARAAEAARLAERTAVDIPQHWADLNWPELRALASQLTDDTVRSKDDATTAIEAELARRSGN